MVRSPLQPHKAQRLSSLERPEAGISANSGPAYNGAPYSFEQCIRAQGKIRKLLLALHQDPKLATEVLVSMFPVLLANDKKKIVGITQNSVKAAIRKILGT